MKEFKKYELVIGLLILVVILGLLKIKFGYKGGNEEVIVQVTPTTTQVKVNDDYKLWQSLPHSGTGFSIDRYVGPKQLAVKVKGIDKKIVEKEVLKWLTEQKVATESYKLVWE